MDRTLDIVEITSTYSDILPVSIYSKQPILMDHTVAIEPCNVPGNHQCK